MDAIFRTVQEETRTTRATHATSRWDAWMRFYGLALDPPADYTEHYVDEVRTYGENEAESRLERLIPALILEPQIQLLLNDDLLHLSTREVMVQKLTNPAVAPHAGQGLLAITIIHAADGSITTLNLNAQLQREGRGSPNGRYRIDAGTSRLDAIAQLVIQYSARRVGQWILDKYNTPRHIQQEFIDPRSEGDGEDEDDEDDGVHPTTAVYRQLHGTAGLDRRDYDDMADYYSPAARKAAT